jgi:hypothetical protein
MEAMDASTEAALRILDEIKREGVPTGPVVLSEAYLRAVARLEQQPECQSGSDRAWVYEIQRRFREYFACVQRRR